MRKHFFWIAELFIWLLILIAVSGGIMFVKYNYKKNFNTYQLFLPDIDGLINGSPVHLMGIQIGYVNQLDIVGDDVYVKFIVTEKGVKIPHGVIATVEFSGLGGSKSLELYPPLPNRIPSDKYIIPQSPKRIHDSLGLLNDMIGKLMDITYDISHFMDQLGIIKSQAKLNNGPEQKSAADFLKFSDNWLDKAQKNADELNKKLKKKINGEKHEQRQSKNY